MLFQSENKSGILGVGPGFANNFRPRSLDLSEQMLKDLYDTLNVKNFFNQVNKLMQS